MKTLHKHLTIFLIISSISISIGKDQNGNVTYGVDVSFPMHYNKLSTNYPWLPHNVDPKRNQVPLGYKDMPMQPLGNRREFYDNFMKGCRKHNGKRGSACDQVELDRIEMGLLQPQSMVNYTDNGFKKIRAPEAVFKLIKEFWEKNKDKKHNDKESWFTGNTYTNHWDAPTYMVSVEDAKLRGGGYKLKQKIWDAAHDVIQEWTGEELTQCSLYGIRVYEEGAILATHVDRLPLVSSAIINVDQDVDEPWPIEVIGHDGKAYNVTMEPGDMVLYESHSVLHGRPFPLKGRFYANLFVHFEPTGHSLRHHSVDVHNNKDPDSLYEESVKNKIGGHESDHHGLPAYLAEDTPWEAKWRRENDEDWEPTEQEDAMFTTGSSDAHQAAMQGDVNKLKAIAESDPSQLHAVDSNGWKPIHEGSRSRSIDVVSLLVKHGADVNERVENGGTPLYYASEEMDDDNSQFFEFMRSLGAVSIGPDL